MLLRIDPSGDLPLYRQIAAGVRRGIREGEVGPGDRLPAARDLARSLDVNMHTVLRAYRDLADQGLLHLRRGRGAVVAAGSDQVAGVRQLVVELVAEAREQGMGADEVAEMIREEF